MTDIVSSPGSFRALGFVFNQAEDENNDWQALGLWVLRQLKLWLCGAGLGFRCFRLRSPEALMLVSLRALRVGEVFLGSSVGCFGLRPQPES